MTVHFPGLVQTLKWGVQLVLEVQSPLRVTNKFISCDNNMRASSSSLWYKMCTYDFLTNMAAHIDGQKKIRRIVSTFRVAH